MATRTDCYPWWHATYAPLALAPKRYVASGCRVNADGNIPCAPEAMRAKAEAKLRELNLLDGLSLATYTLARYMEGEVGSGTVEERVAVGEAAFNRGKRTPQGVVNLLLYRQPAGHPNRGMYGPIHGVGTGTSTAPYGRWATTSADPTVLTLLLADLVMSGRSGNFTDGADDQDGPEYWIPKGQTSLNNYIRRLASEGKYWIGPRPGVDHWHTFLQYTPGIKATSPEGQALAARGLAALQLPLQRVAWPTDLPICSGGEGGGPSGGEIVLAVAGLAAGVFAGRFAARRLGFMV